MGRAPCCEKVGLKRGRWTTEEDEILTKYIQANGEGSWRSLPKNAGLLRCGKSCRLRWINYLRSDLKRGNISSEEEEIIINLHASLGNRWSLIAGHLPGRTDNEIKNYWNSHLSKKLHSSKTSENDSLPAAPAAPAVMDLAKPEALVKKRKGSRSSRSNMKKNKCSNVPSQSIEEKVPRGPANATVQMPRTPTLEKETLSSAISWEEENINKAIVDPCPSEERTENMADTSPEDGETKTNWMSQSAAKITSGDLWATCDLCLDDVSMGNGELADPDGILSFKGNKETCETVASDDQREHGGGKRTTKDMDPGCCRRPSSNDRQDLETDKLEIMEVSNVGNCEWSVSSPTHYGKLYDWDDWQWDIPVEDVQNDLTTLGDKADMLSWLWDSDNNNGNGDCDDDGPSPGADILDDEKHNAMVAWLLS